MHVLFDLPTYLEAQERFVHHIIPELAELDHPINLNNVKQFDELLLHYETSFKSNVELSAPSPHKYANLVLPSYNVLRIVLTLAARSPNTIWSTKHLTIDGLEPTNEYAKSLNDDYDASVFKAPLNKRSVLLLRTYCKIIVEASHEDPMVQLLYKRILVVLGDFIFQSRVVKRVSTYSGPLIKKRVSQSSPTKQHKITNFFQRSPTKAADELSDTELVSDSETEATVLESGPNMEEELFKYQTSPQKSFLLEANKNVSGLNGSFKLLNSLTSNSDERGLSAPVKQVKIEDNFADAPLHKWENIKVYDDDLLGKKLNPKLNLQFNVWLLFNWAFYCADQSSILQHQHQNSSFTSYHIIYSTYIDLIWVLYDIIAFNFIHTIKTHSHIQDNLDEQSEDFMENFFKSPKSSRTLVLYHLEDSSFLLYCMLTQLSSNPIDWYDRLVEFLLNGLGIKSNSVPLSCYNRERIVVKEDRTMKEKFSTSSNWRSDPFNDNFDSMEIRFKFISLVYYRSLFYSNGSLLGFDRTTVTSSNSPHLNSRSFVSELSRKLGSLDTKYLRAFFDCIHVDNPFIPKFYAESMLVDLAQTLLLDITKVVDYDLFVPKRGSSNGSGLVRDQESEDSDEATEIIDVIEVQDESETEDFSKKPVSVSNAIKDSSWQITNVLTVLTALGKPEAYLPIVEDETYKSSEQFIQCWDKVNFLLEWILGLTFEDLGQYLGENSIVQVDMLTGTREKCVAADKLRLSIFKSYVNNIDYDDGIKNFDKYISSWNRFEHIYDLKLSF